jgi:hypothetical protein
MKNNYISDIENELNELQRLINNSLLDYIYFKIDNKLKFNPAIRIALDIKINNLEKSIRALRDKLQNN